MKCVNFLIVFLFSIPLFAFQGDEKHVLEHNRAEIQPYAHGEIIKYRIHYGFVNAGVAEIEVKDAEDDQFHIIGTGKSTGAFDWFFKVRDRYESYVSKEDYSPTRFIRNVSEGGYKLQQEYNFDQENNMVDDGKGKSIEVPENVQDMLSAYYYARTIDFSEAEIGDVFTVPSFVDGKIWPLKIKFLGRETINVDAGKIKCMKFVPIIQKGRVFKNEEDMLVWISDDANKIPVLARAKVLVGSIKMELKHYEGLANPLALAD